MIARLRAAAFTALALAAPPLAAEPSSQRAVKPAVETIDVACGRLDKQSCAVVLPELNAKIASAGVRLAPRATQGSVESLKSLCAGETPMAIVQEDALVAQLRAPKCAGELRMLGAPLYPYQGFLIVRANVRSSSFADMAQSAQGPLRIAAGGPDSGGDLTFRNILAAAPKWKEAVEITPDEPLTALKKLVAGQVDGVFIMDGPRSTLVKAARAMADPKTKRPAFKFLDLGPDAATLAELRRMGLYSTAKIGSRWFRAIRTIASPAVIVIRDDAFRNRPEVATTIKRASEAALPIIAAEVGAPSDWRRDFDRP